MTVRPGWSWQKGCGISCLGFLIIAVVAVTALFYIAERANRPPNITLPPVPKPPSPNAHDEWVRAANLAAGIPSAGPYDGRRKLDEWTVPELREFVEANREPLEVFHNSMGKDNLYPHTRGAADADRHLSSLRMLARRAADAAYYYERINQPERAAQIRLDVMEMGARLPRGAASIPYLAGVAIERYGLGLMPDLLPQLDRQGLRMVVERLKEIEAKRPQVSENMTEEAYTIVSQEQAALQEERSLHEVYSSAAWQPASREQTGLMGEWREAAFVLADKEALLRGFLELNEEAATVLKGPLEKGKTLPRSSSLYYSEDHYRRMWEEQAYVRTIHNLLQTEAALRLYKKDFGRYPQSLKSLTPEYLDEVPIDWFGGKPLKYKPLNDGHDFRLYSVGKNLKDDGGRIRKEVLWGKQPDIKFTFWCL